MNVRVRPGAEWLAGWSGNGGLDLEGVNADGVGNRFDPAVAHRIRLRRSAGRAVAEVADRLTAYVHGACVGAGVELTAFAARVVADPGTTFWLPELAMGLVPGAGATVSIPRRIGRQRTALLAQPPPPRRRHRARLGTRRRDHQRVTSYASLRAHGEAATRGWITGCVLRARDDRRRSRMQRHILPVGVTTMVNGRCLSGCLSGAYVLELDTT